MEKSGVSVVNYVLLSALHKQSMSKQHRTTLLMSIHTGNATRKISRSICSVASTVATVKRHVLPVQSFLATSTSYLVIRVNRLSTLNRCSQRNSRAIPDATLKGRYSHGLCTCDLDPRICPSPLFVGSDTSQ